jgi:hypothetical protein
LPGANGDITLTSHLGLGPVDAVTSADEIVSVLKKSAQIVISATVLSKQSQLTSDQRFIYSSYEMRISSLVKNDSSTALSIGDTITVIRPGGRVTFDGNVVRAVDAAYEALPGKNHEILLFLKHIPESSSFETIGPEGAFDISDSSLRPLTKIHVTPGKAIRETADLLKAVSITTN